MTNTTRRLDGFIREQPSLEMLRFLLEKRLLDAKDERKVTYLLSCMESGRWYPAIREVRAGIYSAVAFFVNSGHYESAYTFSSMFSHADSFNEPVYARTAATCMVIALEVGAIEEAKSFYERLRRSSAEIPERFLAHYLNQMGIAARYFEPDKTLQYFREALDAALDDETRAMIRSNMLLYIYVFGSNLNEDLFVSDHELTSIAHGIDELNLLYLLEVSRTAKAKTIAERLKKINQENPFRLNTVQTHAYLGHYYLETSDADHARQELHETIQILNKQFSVFRFGESAFLASHIYYHTGEFARSLLTLLLARECLESNRLFCRFHRHLYRRITAGLEEQLLGSTRKQGSDAALSLETLVSELTKASAVENGEDQVFLGECLWAELLARRSSTIHLIPPLSRRIMCGVSKGFSDYLKCNSVLEETVLANLPENSDFITVEVLEKLTSLVEALLAPGKPR